jgi:TolB-like protein
MTIIGSILIYDRTVLLGNISFVIAGISGLIILLFAAVGLSYWFFANRPANLSNIESIAVMPFQNESGNADNEYLSDGMTESLITSLSQLPKLSVKARNSVFRYKGKEVEPRKAGAELSVQAILLGRVVQRGQDLTLYVELVDANTENILWKADYNRPMTNLVSLQNEIARDVSQKLQARISNPDAQKVTKSYTANSEAYQLYLKGRFHLNKQNEEGYKKSLDYFQQAVGIDPNYALAYTGIADSYFLAADWYLSNKEAMERAKAAATRALEIDDMLGEAHSSMGTIRVFYDWNWSAGERELKRAIEINPNNIDARLTYGFYLGVVSGQSSEAVEQTKQALQIDPLSLLGNGSLGVLLMGGRQYDQAIGQFRKTLELDPNFWWAHQWLGETYARNGQFPEAIAELQKARQSDPNPQILGKLGLTYARSGNKAEAQKLIDELNSLSEQRYVSSIFVAEIFAALGERDKAFEWLEKGFEERSIGILFLKNDPLWDNLRSDSRFQNLVRRIGFP